MKAGDLSASPTPIYDPFTGAANGTGRSPFAGNKIPANRLDPITRTIVGAPSYVQGAGAGLGTAIAGSGGDGCD